MPSRITQNLLDRLRARDAAGFAKYGQTLDRNDLSVEQWLDHLTEELLDGAGYAQSAKREIAALKARIFQLENRIHELENHGQNL